MAGLSTLEEGEAGRGDGPRASGQGPHGLDGLEFMTMAEAGEVGHWAILGKLNEKAGDEQISELVDWALPIQEHRFDDVKEGSLSLAAEEGPGS